MKEVVFIKKNEPSWKSLEKALAGKKVLSPDEMAEHYIQVTDDLSYAQTFYPDSKVIPYLNNLALNAHQYIYRNKKEKKSRFIDFWKYEVPKAVLASHKEMLYSLIIFAVAIGIGVFSSMLDDDYVRLILGDYYVNMTLENIDKGDPMAVYKSASRGNMFFGISTNNVRVSFLAFVLGIFGSLGTGMIMVYNGVMVGAFQYFFIKQGLFWISFSTIFIHGALELSEIVIAGGAGLVLGNSLLFPGTYSRTVSLVRAAKRSLKIIIGSVPVVIVAALIESYLTRLYLEMGSVLRILIIATSFAYIIWYYIIYPKKLQKDGRLEFINTSH